MKERISYLFFAFLFLKILYAKNSEELIREGIRLSNEGKREEAIAFFKEAIELDEKRSSLAWHNLGYTYEIMGKKEEARFAYQNALMRNPNLLQSRANLGKVEFQLGLYQEAVANGEAVLALDPNNFEVNQYLPEARRKLQEQKMSIQSGPMDKTYAPQEGPVKKEGGDIFYETGFSIITPFSYNKQNDATILYQQSGFTGIPYNFFTIIDVPKNFGVLFEINNPYLGILTPRFIAGQQRVEYYQYFKSFSLGLGMFFTQLYLENDNGFGQESFITNRDYSRVDDNKLGLVFGFQNPNRRLFVRIFPRYLFRDPSNGPKSNEFDWVFLELSLRNKLFLFSSESATIAKSGQDLFLNIRMEEFYLTEYKYNEELKTKSHWFASYLFELGFEFNTSSNNKWGFSYAERLYFRNLNNNNPWAFGNGQGYFGFHSELALQGNTFPSFRSNAHLFQLFFKQLVFNRVLLREKIGVEVTTPQEPVHSFFLEFGLSFYFHG